MTDRKALAAEMLAASGNDAWLAREIIRRASILGCNVDAEGKHFRLVLAAEYLGRQGWTVADVQHAAS